MSFVKTNRFKRTIKFKEPGGDSIDQMIEQSFVAEFEKVPNDELEEKRLATPGGYVRDAWLAKRALKAAHDVKEGDTTLTGDDAIAAVLSNSTAVGAIAKEYTRAMHEGIAVKNSAT